MAKQAKPTENKEDEPQRCGLVMPISTFDGCTEQHWADVKEILVDAIDGAGFNTTLVSEADDVGIIQRRIIQNLYDNPIIVCDVSGKNPNVMFELGIRLAFDKPTIIVKDDKTSYSFDTAPIEHLEYPRDLRFTKIVEFKNSLSEKVKATYEKSQADADYTTFLKHFGKFTVAKLDITEVSKEDFMLEELRELRRMIRRQFGPGPVVSSEREVSRLPRSFRRRKGRAIIIEAVNGIVEELSKEELAELPDMETKIVSMVKDRVPVRSLCDSEEEFLAIVKEALYP